VRSSQAHKLAAFTRHLRLQVRAIKRVRRTHPVKTSANRHSECVVDLGDFTAALFEFFAGDRGLSLSLCAPVGINGSYAGRDKLGHLFHDAVYTKQGLTVLVAARRQNRDPELAVAWT
jgi:hypothetical protein